MTPTRAARGEQLLLLTPASRFLQPQPAQHTWFSLIQLSGGPFQPRAPMKKGLCSRSSMSPACVCVMSACMQHAGVSAAHGWVGGVALAANEAPRFSAQPLQPPNPRPSSAAPNPQPNQRTKEQSHSQYQGPMP
jgi:hypothetical protein